MVWGSGTGNYHCKRPFVFINVYRPPSKENVLEFIDLLDESLNIIQQNDDAPVLLSGDFNVNCF